MQKWVEITTDIDTVNWKGEAMLVKNVKALKNAKTGSIRVYPSEIAKAEIEQLAECFNLQPRDVGTLLMIFAKPAYFREGEVFYKYHLQKHLFYLWKYMENNGYGQSVPIDNFIAAENGPKPENLDADLERLEHADILEVKQEKNEYGESKKITLTHKGIELSKLLWSTIAEPYKEVAIKVKERIHPLSPERVRHLVHNEYPEYKDAYVKNDIE